MVKLSSSAVNPSDVKKRMGASPTLLKQGYVIPNSDGAGVIEAVGEGVGGQRLGERVWVYNGQAGRRMGTCGSGNQSGVNQGVGQVNSMNARGAQRKAANKRQGQGKNRGNTGAGQQGRI